MSRRTITPPSDIQIEGHDIIKSFPGDTREATDAGGRYTNAHGVETPSGPELIVYYNNAIFHHR
jgi:hypothetical protein